MKEDAGSSLLQSYSHHGRESTERSGFLRGPMLPTYLPTTSLFLPRPVRHNTAATLLPLPLAEGCMCELFALRVQSCLSCEMCKGAREVQAGLWVMEEEEKKRRKKRMVNGRGKNGVTREGEV